jgi:hypothetical protein
MRCEGNFQRMPISTRLDSTRVTRAHHGCFPVQLRWIVIRSNEDSRDGWRRWEGTVDLPSRIKRSSSNWAFPAAVLNAVGDLSGTYCTRTMPFSKFWPLQSHRESVLTYHSQIHLVQTEHRMWIAIRLSDSDKCLKVSLLFRSISRARALVRLSPLLSTMDRPTLAVAFRNLRFPDTDLV